MAVVDANIALAWLIEHPLSTNARRWMDADNQAPSLILTEVTNALWKYVTLRDFPLRDALDAVSDIRDYFSDSLVPDADLLDQALKIGAEINHPVYDCLYLALALDRGATLVTADRRLALAATNMKIAADFVESQG